MNNETEERNYEGSIDLALEANELAAKRYGDSIPGIETRTEQQSGIKMTVMDVRTPEAGRSIGKLPGHYITFEVTGLRQKNTELQDKLATKLAKEFEGFLKKLNISKDAKVLVVGLGNTNVTADALGPLVVENIMVTRHYFQLVPEDVGPGYREVSAIAPGVLGTTGIESSEIVQGIIDRSKPDLVIAIDALAARSLDRVNTTIQVADTGIHPGSGIGNKRKGLTQDILGVPVIAIGVPTVVYASTIVNNSIDMMVEHFKEETDQAGEIFGMLHKLSETDRLMLVKEVLHPIGQDLLVTPKEIDQFIEDIANIVASGLNAALHEAVDTDNVAAFTH